MYSSIAAFVFLASALSAQAPADERFYQAIRSNDLAALRTLIAAEGVNARDGLGQTPLMLASAFGSLDAVRALLAAGADARAGVQRRRHRPALGGNEPRENPRPARRRRRRQRLLAARTHAAPRGLVGP